MADDTQHPVLTLTPLNPAFREDPHTILKGLREHHPVMRDDMAGVFFISRYEDVRSIVTDLTLWRGPEHAEEAAPVSAIPCLRPSTSVSRSSGRKSSVLSTRPSTGSVTPRPLT